MPTGRKHVQTIAETASGRNVEFQDSFTRRMMTRADFVRKIEAGLYTGYHIRMINGIKTPVSNPDHSLSDNLN